MVISVCYSKALSAAKQPAFQQCLQSVCCMICIILSACVYRTPLFHVISHPVHFHVLLCSSVVGLADAPLVPAHLGL
jgi:hypothetical protein